MNRVHNALYLLGFPAPGGADLLVVGQVSQRGVLDLFCLVSHQEESTFALSRKSLDRPIVNINAMSWG